MFGINWSEDTLEGIEFRKQINSLYSKALERVRGFKIYGKEIDLSNPKEVVALLFILSEDYNSFHEKF